MISNAKNIKIGQSRLPNMSQTIKDWFQSVTFGVVKTEIVDYERQITVENVNTQGVVQPYKPEPLEIQQAGVQSWSWLMIHCLPDLQLFNNDFIFYENVKYKVLMRSDYSKYGYMQYIVCEAFDE